MIDKAIEEFKHQFCDWNKPSIFVNSKTQPKMDFLRKKLKEMRDACAKEADEYSPTAVAITIAEAIRKVE